MARIRTLQSGKRQEKNPDEDLASGPQANPVTSSPTSRAPPPSSSIPTSSTSATTPTGANPKPIVITTIVGIPRISASAIIPKPNTVFLSPSETTLADTSSRSLSSTSEQKSTPTLPSTFSTVPLNSQSFTSFPSLTFSYNASSTGSANPASSALPAAPLAGIVVSCVVAAAIGFGLFVWYCYRLQVRKLKAFPNELNGPPILFPETVRGLDPIQEETTPMTQAPIAGEKSTETKPGSGPTLPTEKGASAKVLGAYQSPGSFPPSTAEASFSTEKECAHPSDASTHNTDPVPAHAAPPYLSHPFLPSRACCDHAAARQSDLNNRVWINDDAVPPRLALPAGLSDRRTASASALTSSHPEPYLGAPAFIPMGSAREYIPGPIIPLNSEQWPLRSSLMSRFNPSEMDSPTPQRLQIPARILGSDSYHSISPNGESIPESAAIPPVELSISSQRNSLSHSLVQRDRTGEPDRDHQVPGTTVKMPENGLGGQKGGQDTP